MFSFPGEKSDILGVRHGLIAILPMLLKRKKPFGTIKCAALMTPQSLRSLENYANELKLDPGEPQSLYFKKEIHFNAKPFWSFFKLKTGRRSYPDTMLLESNIEVTSDLDKAIAFSKHFQSIFTDHSLCSFPTSNLMDQPSLSEIVLSVDEVLANLKGLNTRKASGPDEIPAKLIVECAEVIASSVCDLFNLSLSTGRKFFTEWKDANIIPLSRRNQHYRGISLLPILSKILERCVARRIVSFTQDRIYHFNTASVMVFPDTTQLLAVLYAIGKAWTMETKLILYILILPVHSIPSVMSLQQKLLFYGITGGLFDWITDYLFHRRQRAVVNGTSSPWVDVCSGVPQGSVLGLILFILYINDLPDSVSFSNIAMFADDTKCFHTIKIIAMPTIFNRI